MEIRGGRAEESLSVSAILPTMVAGRRLQSKAESTKRVVWADLHEEELQEEEEKRRAAKDGSGSY